MSDVGKEERLVRIKNAVDYDVVAENILDVAEFTVEKYEFRNESTLAPDVRAEAVERIRDVLWQKVEALKLRRHRFLQDMFNTAQSTLEDVIAKG